MRISQSWIIASKDFATFSKKKNIIYSIVVVPLLISILLPLVVWYSQHYGRGGGMSAAELTVILPAFTFLYLIIGGLIPVTIASYSLVGEKVERSLEPLLATPTTDGEILFGKGIAAFIPSIVAILGGSTLFMALMDVATRDRLGYNFFPNWNAAIVLFIMVPLAVVLSVEYNILVSSRVSDIRIAQQIGVLFMLPLGGIYLAGELNMIPLGVANNLLIISAILFVAVLLFLYIARATFRRDEILTKWK